MKTEKIKRVFFQWKKNTFSFNVFFLLEKKLFFTFLIRFNWKFYSVFTNDKSYSQDLYRDKLAILLVSRYDTRNTDEPRRVAQSTAD